jgi:tRNA threonylcarbamoyladenosine biosynthesis protein TsaE
MKEIIIENIDCLPSSAAKFINYMNGKKIFAFEGNMGAGKTTFIKAICKELGVKDDVNSPTFSIINEYRSSITDELIYHFDFYRINNIDEAQNIGVEDYFYSDALCFIEWPEKAKKLLPDNAVFVNIKELFNGSRSITW